MQDEGFLAKILVQAGSDTVKVGQPIAVAVEDEADLQAAMAADYSDAMASSGSSNGSDDVQATLTQAGAHRDSHNADFGSN